MSARPLLDDFQMEGELPWLKMDPEHCLSESGSR